MTSESTRVWDSFHDRCICRQKVTKREFWESPQVIYAWRAFYFVAVTVNQQWTNAIPQPPTVTSEQLGALGALGSLGAIGALVLAAENPQTTPIPTTTTTSRPP